MIPDHLRLQPGQEALTPEQEREARRFAEERIALQLATSPVNEAEAEARLRAAYQVAGLDVPATILWLDGPLPFVRRLPLSYQGIHVWKRLWHGVANSVAKHGLKGVGDSVRASAYHHIFAQLEARVRVNIAAQVEKSLRASVGSSRYLDNLWKFRTSVGAYYQADRLAFYRFFDEYLAPNALHALAHFNELVSGYWLGKKEALLVRRPRLLSRDQEGRLHSSTGKCIEYRDGWGLYAWHGVEVPERVILAPERLSREDFLHEPNVEVRRIIQERMGTRFVSELGGKAIDTGPRGTLYEVRLPEDDPEGVARYVQVQDASTERRYLLRVPPSLQTAAEAVAWTFQVAVEDYRPTQET